MPSNKLEGRSVMNSVIVDKLFVECFYGVSVRVF